jgi:hypothetical protein
MAEVIGAAWAVEKVVETAKEMGELGEKTENTAAALGISAKQFSLMSSAMAIAGGNADTASRGLILLQSKLVEAVENPASKAREAFLAMGISVEQMKAGPNDVPGFMRLIADGFVAMGEGAERTAVMRDVFGRMFTQIVPYIKEGAKGIDEYNKKAEATRAPVSEEDVKRLAEVGQKFNIIGQDVLGLPPTPPDIARAGPMKSWRRITNSSAQPAAGATGGPRAVKGGVNKKRPGRSYSSFNPVSSTRATG